MRHAGAQHPVQPEHRNRAARPEIDRGGKAQQPGGRHRHHQNAVETALPVAQHAHELHGPELRHPAKHRHANMQHILRVIGEAAEMCPVGQVDALGHRAQVAHGHHAGAVRHGDLRRQNLQPVDAVDPGRKVHRRPVALAQGAHEQQRLVDLAHHAQQ